MGSIAWGSQPIMRLICASVFNLLLQPLGLIFNSGLLALTKPALITCASRWVWYQATLAGLALAPFCCLVVIIIALRMNNQLCAVVRQSRGTMTFGVQWAIAARKQITWIPRGFGNASFNATQCLATPAYSHHRSPGSIPRYATHRALPILPPN